MDRLGAIETFLRVVESGSFHRAASLQGTSPQAVSKTIRQLEKALGLRLFHRSTRSSKLSDEGQAFLQRVRPGLTQIEQAWTQTCEQGAEQSGLIRIAAPRLAGIHLLVPLIAQWREQAPGVEFELLLDDQYTDLEAAGIHLGFRAGQPPERQLVVRELFRMQVLVCAAPAYLRRHGIPRSIADLDRHHCTGSRQPRTGRVEPWEFMAHGELHLQPMHSPLYTNDFEVELRAIEAGIGIGQLDSISCAQALREGRLVPLLCEHHTQRHSFTLYYRPRSELPRRVQRFIDFALQHLQGGAGFVFTLEELQSLQRKAIRGLRSKTP